MRVSLVGLLVVLSATASAAGEKTFATGEDLLKKVGPLVGERTYLAGHVDVASLDPEPFLRLLEKAGAPAKEMAGLREKIGALRRTFLDAGGEEIFVLMNMSGRLSAEADLLVAIPLGKNAKVADLENALRELRPPGMIRHRGFLVLGTKLTLDALGDLEPKERPDLARGLNSLNDCPARVVVVPPAILRKALAEMMPNLPKELGGGATSVLIRGLEWMALGVRGKDLAQRLVVQSADEKAAGELLEWVKVVQGKVAEIPEVRQVIPDIETLRKALTPHQEKDRLVLTVEPKHVVTVLLEPVKKMRSAAGRGRGMNNLRQIGLALHNYHDTYRSFPPPGIKVRKGKGKLSWRVHLLPFLEQAPLYQEFHLDEPWDSPHNKKLIARMPAVFRSPSAKNVAEGKTTYLAPVGKGTVFADPDGMELRKILDGTSNTVLVVDADDSRAVFWTQPEDLKVEAKNAGAGMFRPKSQGTSVLFGDGSVRYLSASIDPQVLWALFTAAGGEVIPDLR